MRLSEHKRACRYGLPNSAVAQHSLELDHNINFREARMIWHCSNIHKRRVVESVIMSSLDTFQGNKPFIYENKMINKHICKGLNIELEKRYVNSLQHFPDHSLMPLPQQHQETVAELAEN